MYYVLKNIDSQIHMHDVSTCSLHEKMGACSRDPSCVVCMKTRDPMPICTESRACALEDMKTGYVVCRHIVESFSLKYVIIILLLIDL